MKHFRQLFEDRVGIKQYMVTGAFNVETYELLLKACESFFHEVDGETIKDTGHEALLMKTFPENHYNKSEWRGFSVKAGNIFQKIYM